MFDVVRFRGENTPHGAGHSDTPGQGAGVDSLDSERFMGLQKLLQALARAPVARRVLMFPDDESFQMDSCRLHILRVDSGVSDERAGHHHDLPLVGGVGKDFLVAGHPRVENDLAQDFALPGKDIPPVNTSILQDQQGLFSSLPEHSFTAPQF